MIRISTRDIRITEDFPHTRPTTTSISTTMITVVHRAMMEPRPETMTGLTSETKLPQLRPMDSPMRQRHTSSNGSGTTGCTSPGITAFIQAGLLTREPMSTARLLRRTTDMPAQPTTIGVTQRRYRSATMSMPTPTGMCTTSIYREIRANLRRSLGGFDEIVDEGELNPCRSSLGFGSQLGNTGRSTAISQFAGKRPTSRSSTVSRGRGKQRGRPRRPAVP